MSILGNIIGTGLWFDAYASNLLAIPTGEFQPGFTREVGDGRPEPGRRPRRGGRRPLLVVTVYVVWLRDDTETKTLTAHFPRAVSIYEGSDVGSSASTSAG